ncbi:MAG TPA: DUF1840 domain-containing protein [Caldimonas sp.]|jgi:hypothetical protein|nr:DUF1840 domain-containing protein [Caldimonas sp.]HEX2540424.1 DUF1840 domain-containing protein [Caldimonas sp.]
MYRFKSKADGDLIMMAPVGDQMLRLIGREPAAQGIIEVGQLPAAIAALERAIADAEAQARKTGAGAADDDGNDGARGVGIQQRAWPLLEMMRRSLAQRADIVWGV